MTKTVKVQIEGHGEFAFTAEAVDLVVARHLPNSIFELRKVVAEEVTGSAAHADQFADVETITELLAILADIETGRLALEEAAR